MRLSPGARLGPYEIRAALGAGGMGEVYRARDPRLARDVAVKVLPAGTLADEEHIRRFEREARAAGALNHPNILVVFDTGFHGDLPYVVSELLEGETLRKRLEQGPLPARKAFDYALQIAQGLAAAHEKGIVHRDLKPENLFLTKDGRVKILDFGLARRVRAPIAAEATTLTGPATEPGAVLGTVGYMSPEQVRGLPADPRSDIFSFGAVLYEMLSGRRAFQRDTAAQTMTAILSEDPPELSRPGPDVPPALDRVLRRCLEKRPEERFQSARDIAFALEAVSGSPPSTAPAPAAAAPRPVLRLWAGAAIVSLAVGLALGLLAGRRIWQKPPPAFQQVTFRRGTIPSARFAPDGQTFVYAAAWDGDPVQVFTSRSGSPESTSLPFPGANLLAMSRSGEMAVSLRHRPRGVFHGSGTLARAPLAGGAPREVLEDVQWADWAPDGAHLVVVRSVGGRSRLEFPIGKVLYESGGWISHPRFSPDGQRIALLDHPGPDDAGSVEVVDPAGHRTTLSKGWFSVQGLAWHPGGREVWFTAARTGANSALRAATLSGRERLIVQVPARLTLHDIFRDGRVLLTREGFRTGVVGLPPGATKELDLSWLDGGVLEDLSADGSTVLIGESGEGAGAMFATYLRRMDGSAAIRLGEGFGGRLSPDGKWALAVLRSEPTQLVLLPTGAGDVRPLERHGIGFHLRGWWFPDGRRVLFSGNEPGRGARLYVQDLTGGRPRALTPEGVSLESNLGDPISPDGKWITGIAPDWRLGLYPVEGGEPRRLSALEPGDQAAGWAAYGRVLYVLRSGELPARVYRLDLSSRRAELWKEILPSDPAGVSAIFNFLLTPNARSYAYTYLRQLSELFVVDGLR